MCGLYNLVVFVTYLMKHYGMHFWYACSLVQQIFFAGVQARTALKQKKGADVKFGPSSCLVVDFNFDT